MTHHQQQQDDIKPDPDDLVFVDRTPDGDLWLEPFPPPPPIPGKPRGRRRNGGQRWGASFSLQTPQPTETGRVWSVVLMLSLALICGGLGIGGGVLLTGDASVSTHVAPVVPRQFHAEGPAAKRLRLIWRSNYRWVMEPGDIEEMERAYRDDTGREIDDAP